MSRTTKKTHILILLLSMAMIVTGCVTISKNADTDQILKDAAISVAAKVLGANMAEDGYEWTDTNEQFYDLIVRTGITIDSATLMGDYIDSNVPNLYREEANSLAKLVGFTVSTEGYDPKGADYDRVMIALSGFRKGVLSVNPL